MAARYAKMNAGDSKKSFHHVNDIAIIVMKALLRAVCELHLQDAEPIRRERIFVQQNDPAFVGGSSGRPDALLTNTNQYETWNLNHELLAEIEVRLGTQPVIAF
jgi:hypothetical protein